MSPESNKQSSGRILALDYGRIHTGAAISDPTGTLVRPLETVSQAATPAGIQKIADLAKREGAAKVIVGLPVSLTGEKGAQARETEEFIELLKAAVPLTVISWDERFTSKIAQAKGRESAASQHSLAACCLLEDYLNSAEFRKACP